MARNLAESASNCKHVVARNDVRTLAYVLDVTSVRMIADVNDVSPLRGPLQQDRKEKKSIRISKPFAEATERR
jgi:hypothetical protein